MRLPFLTPRQTSRCRDCGLVITERRRRPCPVCGCLNRAVVRYAFDGMTTHDKAS